MKVSALQEFLHNLGGSLGAVGVPPKSLEELRTVAKLLEPFKELDLEHLADFLRRAGEYRGKGELPLVAVPGLDDATRTAHELGQTVQTLGQAESSQIGELERRVSHDQEKLQSTLAAVAGNFGLAVTFKSDKKWLPNLSKKARAKAEEAAKARALAEHEAAVARAVGAFRQIQPRITAWDSYQSEEVKAAIAELAQTDGTILKEAAGQLGVSGKGKGTAFVQSSLVQLTNIDSKQPKVKAPKQAKPPEPTASEEQVEATVKELEVLVEKAKDPNAVSDAEIDALLNRVSTEFSSDQQKAIAKRVTGQGGRSAQGAIENLRADLTAVKRALESQKV